MIGEMGVLMAGFRFPVEGMGFYGGLSPEVEGGKGVGWERGMGWGGEGPLDVWIHKSWSQRLVLLSGWLLGI